MKLMEFAGLFYQTGQSVQEGIYIRGRGLHSKRDAQGTQTPFPGEADGVHHFAGCGIASLAGRA